MEPDSFEGNSEESVRAELGSYKRGLRRRYASNQQIIALWREYGRIARTLRRDYRGREDEIALGMVANWITASSLAEAALDILLAEQVSIDSEIAELSGQLPLGAEYVD
jgi:hypothetical protein